MQKALRTRKHPRAWLPEVPYDVEKRHQLISKLNERDATAANDLGRSDAVPCILTFCREVKALRIRDRWKAVRDTAAAMSNPAAEVLKSLDIVMAYRNATSAFLQTYPCNFAWG